MDKTLLDSAINAIRALVVAELDTDSPARFTRAMKLCQQAHALVQMGAKRVGDVVETNYDNYGNGTGHIIGGLNIGGLGAGIAVRNNGPADGIDLVREIISAMGEMNKPKADSARLENLAKVRELAVAAGRSTTEIDKQIDAEIALATKETPHALAPVPVVDPLLLRGRSLGGAGQEALQDDRLEGDGEGAGGNFEVVHACREEDVADGYAAAHRPSSRHDD